MNHKNVNFAISLVLGGALLLCSCGAAGAAEESTAICPAVGSDQLLAAAAYPQMAPYPQDEDYLDANTGEYDSEAREEAYQLWQEGQEELAAAAAQTGAETSGESLRDFWFFSMQEFLSGTEGENQVYSPVSVYLALAMLAETAGGESRSQILETLGVESMEALRAQAQALWLRNYCDDGQLTSILGSSLWLREEDVYRQETLDLLAEHYYASAFRGVMGSEEYSKALRDWINGQTGGLLEEQASELSFSADTVLALVSTIYYKAGWQDAFEKSGTVPEAFSAPGGELTCDFMHQSDSCPYYSGRNFTATAQSLTESGSMWFLLPSEGVSPEELLRDEEACDFLMANAHAEGLSYEMVNLSLPKFDVSSDIDLIEGLVSMGIHDVFEAGLADFSPLMPEKGEELAVTRAEHATRVRVDEEGCEAAAYTVIMIEETAAVIEAEEIDFVLDRPFLFAITNSEGLPLFVGIVNQPEG